jgi:hypothetical protein
LAFPAEASRQDGLGRPDQEERSFPPSFDTCAGAVAWRLLATLAACATRQASHAAGLLFCQLACLQTDCAMAQHGAPFRAGRGQLGVKAGCGVPRRNLAHSGARRRAARRGQARDGALIWQRQRAGRVVWLMADSAWNTLATASEDSGRAPSLRRQTVADSALGWSCGPT